MRLLVALFALVFTASVAVADPRTEAMLLFDQGQKEMKAGQFEKACNSFERSIAVYPDSGTKGSLARCYEKLGRLASAWLMWRQLADLAPSPDLRKDAAAQAAKLAPRVAHYLLKIANPAPGLTLTINGKAAALTDIPVPIDAGGVIVRAYAPNRKDWSAELAAVDGQQLTIEVPELETAVVTTMGNENKQPPPPPPPKRPLKKWPLMRVMGFGVVLVGVTALVLGGIAYLDADDKFGKAEQLCGGSIDRCNDVAGAQPLVDEARSAGTRATILGVAGLGLALGGTLIQISAMQAEKKRVAVRPVAGPQLAGVALSGRF